MKKAAFIISLLLVLFLSSFIVNKEGDFYQLKIYTLESEEQEARMDNYLEKALVPALHETGIKKVGVFKSIEGKNDSSKLIVVFIPLKSVSQLTDIDEMLNRNKQYLSAGKDYIDAPFDHAPYERFESVLLKAFSSYPAFRVPEYDSKNSDRVYELRSYESATEKIHKQKVKMFNSGETDIFVELGFQPVFFGEVISGSHMPNLMYMTCHENESEQAENWKAFGKHPKWQELKAMDEYANTVSHIDKFFLYPAEYSDI